MTERVERWRLILGRDEASSAEKPDWSQERFGRMDECLEAVYGSGKGSRTAGSGGSMPQVARHLAGLRELFPVEAVQVVQRDAISRMGLREILGEPEFIEMLEPDVNLAAALLVLKEDVPDQAKAAARRIVAHVAEGVRRRLEHPLRSALTGSLSRAERNRRPRLREIDWDRTIRANLRNYLPEHHTIVPEVLRGFGRRRSQMKHVILCIDESASMAESVVYSGVFAAVMASLPALRTDLLAFDTAVVDLSEAARADPVEALFGVRLGGGTDIDFALAHCQARVERPTDTALILVSDLCENGKGGRLALLGRARDIVASGVRMVALLALSDHGAPAYDGQVAAGMAALGIPTFACTPAWFPDVMARALSGRDIASWVAEQNGGLVRG